MSSWVYEFISEFMSSWVSSWVSLWVSSWVSLWMSELMNEWWMIGFMREWVSLWMSEFMTEFVSEIKWKNCEPGHDWVNSWIKYKFTKEFKSESMNNHMLTRESLSFFKSNCLHEWASDCFYVTGKWEYKHVHVVDMLISTEFKSTLVGEFLRNVSESMWKSSSWSYGWVWSYHARIHVLLHAGVR